MYCLICSSVISQSDVSLSKNKRKRDAQKKAKQQQQQVGSGKDESTSQKDALATAQYLLGGGTKEESGGENEKRIKNLKKVKRRLFPPPSFCPCVYKLCPHLYYRN